MDTSASSPRCTSHGCRTRGSWRAALRGTSWEELTPHAGHGKLPVLSEDKTFPRRPRAFQAQSKGLKLQEGLRDPAEQPGEGRSQQWGTGKPMWGKVCEARQRLCKSCEHHKPQLCQLTSSFNTSQPVAKCRQRDLPNANPKSQGCVTQTSPEPRGLGKARLAPQPQSSRHEPTGAAPHLCPTSSSSHKLSPTAVSTPKPACSAPGAAGKSPGCKQRDSAFPSPPLESEPAGEKEETRNPTNQQS